MARVAELEVGVTIDDDASSRLMALDALVKGLAGEDLNIDVDLDAGDAQAQLKALMAELQAINDKKVEVKVDADGMAEIERLKAELAAIGDERININAHVDTTSLRRASIDMSKFSNTALAASRSVNGLFAAVVGLGPALVPLGAVAVGGVMGLTGAFTAAAAGAGLFGLVAVSAFEKVKDTLATLDELQSKADTGTTLEKRTKAYQEMRAAILALSREERQMVIGVKLFQNAWADLVEKFQPAVFSLAGRGLAFLSTMFPVLEPILRSTAAALDSLMTSAIAALTGPFWSEFFGMLGNEAGPMLGSLVRSIGNLITGFAGLILAFMPMTKDFTGGLEEMTARFAAWSMGLRQNQGFQTFVQYIRDNTPKVLALIASIWNALVALSIALAPIGEVLVDAAHGIIDFITNFQRAHPILLTLTLAFFAFSVALIKLAGPALIIGRMLMAMFSGFGLLKTILAPVMTALGLTSGVLLGIVAVVAAVVVGLIYAYTHFETFRNIVNNVASGLADFGKKVYTAIVGGLQTAASWLSTTFGPAVQAVIDFAVEQFDKIMAWVSENKELFIAAWNDIKTVVGAAIAFVAWSIQTNLAIIQAIWNAVWPTLSAIIQGAWEIIKGIISGSLDWIMGFITVALGLLTGDWDAVWRGLGQMLQGAWETIVGIVRGGFEILKATWTATFAVLKALWNVFWSLLIAGLTSAWNTIKTIVSTAWNAVKVTFTTFQRAVQTAVNAFWQAVIAVFRGAWNLLIAGLASAWNTIRSGTTAAWNGIKSAISATWNAIYDAVSSKITSIKGKVSGVWNEILGFVRGLTGSFRSAGSSIINAMGEGVMSAIAGVKSKVSGAISSITDLLPGSPAKEGPLSGQGYALIRGQHLGEDLAAGISSRAGMIESAARGIASAMSMPLDTGGLAGAASSGRGRSGASVQVAPGALVVQVGSGVSLDAARSAFDGAGDQFASTLLTALQRRA
jgi:phage-related protein